MVSALLSLALLAGGVLPALAGFQPHQTFPVGPAPTSVAAADLNGDGKPDLAVANNNNNNVSVLLNITPTGATTPTFATQQTFATGTSPRSVATADLNGDGKPDLAIANFSNDNVSVLLNTTPTGAITPTFATHQTFGVGTFPISVAAADLNGDGRPDLASANQDSANVSVLLNTTPTGVTTPTFATQQTFATGTSPTSVAAADLNGDGRPDLASANQNSDNVSVLLNTTPNGATTPTFASHQTFGTGTAPFSVGAADLDNDGKLDLAIANNSGAFGNSVSLLRNTTPNGAATPTFDTQVLVPVGTGPVSVVAADFDGDGKPDLATANSGADNITVLLNTAGVQPPVTAGDSPSSVVAADLNGDGKLDLAITNSGDANVSVLLSLPSGTVQFSSPTVTVAEGAGTATLTLTRTGSTDGQISAIVSLTSGTATQGPDFVYSAPQTVTWANGDGANKTITIPIAQDQLDEPNETVLFSLTLPDNPFGAVIGPQFVTSLIITDDDPTVGNCTPRPRVAVTSTASGGKLQAHVASTPLTTGGANPLTSLTFDTLRNAKVTVNGQNVVAGQTVTVPANATTADFTVERVTAGQATTVEFTVVDSCGSSKTFVGGGAGAGF